MAAVLFWAGAACADSTFEPDAEDARRLDLLHGDPLAVSLGALAACTDTVAHYRPSTGEPLDFAAVENTTVRCGRSPASTEEILGVLAAAETAGWVPAVEGGRGGRFRLRKQFGDVWASATVDAGSFGFQVDLSMPPHTSRGDPPAAVEATQGRACLDAVKARTAPPPDCPLHIP